MPSTSSRALLAALCLCALAPPAFAATPTSATQEPTAPATAAVETAIFAVSDADPQKWNLTLGNIANALDGFGKGRVDIELVVYGPGIAMLRKDSAVADKLAAAIAGGVRIVACQNSMRGARLEPADLAPGVGVVPSGVVELIRRQHEGYAYVRS